MEHEYQLLINALEYARLVMAELRSSMLRTLDGLTEPDEHLPIS